MPANKMPEMPGYYLRSDTHSYPNGEWVYTVDATAAYGLACYLAAIEAAKECVPEAMSIKNEFLLPSPAASFNACRETTLTNLTALEQEAKP